MKRWILLVIFIPFILNAKISTSQLILISSNGWNDNQASLQRYEKIDNRWHKIGKKLSIHIGRNGFGWGIGLHKIPKNAKYIKKEGDGRSPAGIFRLLNAFGYEPFDISYPYEVYHRYDHCVDDINSRYYNSIIDSRKVDIDYKSKEYMKFAKDYYKYGIVVDHNSFGSLHSLKGAGSCIFVHIKDKPTAGCSVMTQKEIKKILRWLDKNKNPILIQAPKDTIKSLYRYATKMNL